jgi:hypothetical protein
MDSPARGRETEVPDLGTLPGRNEGGYTGIALAVLYYHVDDAHGVHLLSRVEASAGDELLGKLLSDLAIQERVGTHAREEVEQYLGEAEA